jgi:hypothetical protein
MKSVFPLMNISMVFAFFFPDLKGPQCDEGGLHETNPLTRSYDELFIYSYPDAEDIRSKDSVCFNVFVDHG